MAIKIPILTEFDPKGMKQANAAFANLQGSVRSLGANFALAGAAIATVGVVIGKNVESLARIETINAQTAQTISTMGNAANISATEVEALAGRLESLTAIEAESIQEGANLLLTFGNIRNELGAGNDIFTQTTQIMVDMGVALRKGPVETATMLGKALNDPIQGLTALRRVGVSFTEQQVEQVRVLQQSGDLMGAQKLILQELQNQYGGSGAAYAETFTGQLELMGHELGTIGEEATMAVMPALQMMVEELRELIPVIGPQLKAAIESVDWAGLVQAVVALATFLVTNAEAITFVVTAFFALNTVMKLVNIAIAIKAAAMAVLTTVTGLYTTAVGTATVATSRFSMMLRRTGFGVIVLAFGAAAAAAYEWAEGTDEATVAADDFTDALAGTADQMERLSLLQGSLADFQIPAIPTFSSGGVSRASAAAAEAAAAAARAAAEAQRAAQEVAEANRRAAEEAARALAEVERQAQEERDKAAAAEQAILDKRQKAYESFTDSVKNLFGQIKNSILSSFDLPSLGNSVNSITRNISKLLERTKNFARNISQLSGLGLNSALLQQVIQAGPMAGSQIAAALVSGGSSFIGQINKAYGEFGDLAGGIAMTGTTGAFAGQQTINNYSIEVTGGIATGADVGRAVVNAIRDFERTSGAAWRA
jgi:hypothetical protein